MLEDSKEIQESVNVIRCFCGEWLGIYGEDYHGEMCCNCGNTDYNFMQSIPSVRNRLIIRGHLK